MNPIALAFCGSLDDFVDKYFSYKEHLLQERPPEQKCYSSNKQKMN